MKQSKLLLMEFIGNGPKKVMSQKRTDNYFIDNTWRLDILDLKDYGSENKRGYRYFSVLIDNFSRFGWTIPSKIKNAQTRTNSSKNVLITSERKPNLIETDRGKEFYNSIFQNFRKKK